MMPDGRQKVVVVMPAYNAAKTLRMTYAALPHDMVDLVILVDYWQQGRDCPDRQRTGSRTVRPQPELRLRREPEDLLSGSLAGEGRHYRDGPSGLSV